MRVNGNSALARTTILRTNIASYPKRPSTADKVRHRSVDFVPIWCKGERLPDALLEDPENGRSSSWGDTGGPDGPVRLKELFVVLVSYGFGTLCLRF